MKQIVVDADGPRVEFGTHIVRSTMYDPWWPWWIFTHPDRIEITRLSYLPGQYAQPCSIRAAPAAAIPSPALSGCAWLAGKLILRPWPAGRNNDS